MSDTPPTVPENVLSSAERLAIENIGLGEGLSDSTVSNTINEVKVKKTKVKKSFIGPPPPKNRDAMGNYIPPPGKKPLSTLVHANPGPQYLPTWDLVQKHYPQYTLSSLPRERKKKRGVPGPKYNVSGNLVWGKCKGFQFKGKFPDIRKKSGPGPETAKMKPFKPTGPRCVIGMRPKKCSAFKSSLVMPLNSDAPAPTYNVPSTAWLEKPKTFGQAASKKKQLSGPGPGKYRVTTQPTGPSFTFGAIKQEKSTTIGPGPAKYNKKTTIGTGPKAPLGVWHIEPDYKAYLPGPDEYHRAGFRLDEPGYTMKYRWMDSEIEKTPGPADYAVNRLHQSKGPAFTIKGKKKEKNKSTTPGPGEYSVSPEMTMCDPGKSFGTRWKHLDKTNETSEFQDPQISMPLLPKSPAYTFQGPVIEKKKTGVPSPNKYTPKLPPSRKTITIGKKIPRKANSVGPGPALPPQEDYDDPVCFPCQSAEGFSLKGRHTPLKYEGLKCNALTRPAVKGVNCAPLLG